MSFFFFYQTKGGEEAWQCGLADSREAVMRDAKPTFVTVLDVDAAVDDTMTTEQIRALKYRGPIIIGDVPRLFLKPGQKHPSAM